jgi:hypothetical protein
MRARSVVQVLAGLGILTALTAAAPLPRAHPLVGKWNVEYERGRRMMGGEPEIIMGKGVIEIAEQGDSLIGTMTTLPSAPGGSSPPPSRLAGTGSGAAATLKSSANSRVNMNGEEREVVIATTWELKAEGDNLTGTMTRNLSAMPAASTPTPVKGTRVK